MLVIFPLFFFGGPSYHSPRSITAFWNWGHVLFFFLFVCFIAYKWADEFNWRWAFKISLLVIIIGVAIEFIQSGIDGRTVSSTDVVRDLMGGILGVAWVGKRHFSPRQRWAVLGVSIIIILWNITPVANFAIDEWQARRSFPLLAGFESKRELSRWAGNATWQQSSRQATQGKYSLQVQLTTDKYSGVNLKYFPNDWSNYSALRCNIFNTSATDLPITIRIHDIKHEQGAQRYNDRFNRTFSLASGWNNIQIDLEDIRNAPTNRQMNMDNIRSLGMFVIGQKEEKTIYLDHVRLSK